MKRLSIVYVAVCSIGLCASPIETAKGLLEDTGYLDALINVPWQEWQRLSADQRRTFEERCQYNRLLLESDLSEFLVSKFTVTELEELRSFYGSDVGRKWTQISGARGGFELPELFKATSRWSDGRQEEVKSYVLALKSNLEWRPTGYKGRVGDFTAKPGSSYTGGQSVDVLGGTEEDFIAKFGIPSMREQRTPEVVGLDTVWRAYRVGATIWKGKIVQVSFIRLPDEGGRYVDNMRTKISASEVDAFLKDFSQSRKWSSVPPINSNDVSRSRWYLEGLDVHCTVSDATILLYMGIWDRRPVGP